MENSEKESKLPMIVVAEDSPPNLRIITHLITKFEFDAIACKDGDLAWEFLEKCDIGRVAAVVSDLMMPNMSGLELLSKIRGDERFKHLPFIFVTAISDVDHIKAAAKYNVQGYLLKPVTFEALSEKLKSIFPNAKIKPTALLQS